MERLLQISQELHKTPVQLRASAEFCLTAEFPRPEVIVSEATDLETPENLKPVSAVDQTLHHLQEAPLSPVV